MDQLVRLAKYVFEVNMTLTKLLDTMQDIREDQKGLRNDVHTLLFGEKEEKWFTQKEAAAHLRRDPRTLRNWEATGKIKSHKIGGRRLYSLSELIQTEEKEPKPRQRR